MFQKKNIADIKFEGTNEEFVWRSPITDFETGSKLTVYESQEALFYFNGACVGVLGPGSHILETEHIPFLKKLIQRITGNESIFHAQVYFVNKVVLDIKWGAGDIVYQDPAGPVFNIGCFGQMNLAAEEPRCIVERLVGSEVSLKRSEVEMKFRQLLASQVRDHLVNAMLDNQISIIQLSARLGRIAELLAPDVAQLFGEYGFSLQNFCISGVNIPEDDPEYQRLKRLRANQGLRMSELQLKQQEELMMAQLAAEKTRIEAQAAAFKRQTEGYDYATEKQFEFLNQIASNPGAGAAGISSEMLQMGAGLGMLGAVGGMMQNMTSPYMNGMGAMTGVPQPMAGQTMGGGLPTGAGQTMDGMQNGAGQTMDGMQGGAGQTMAGGMQSGAGQTMDGMQGGAGQMAAVSAADPVEVLGKLKRLLDAGLIEQEEYDAKKREILANL